MARGIRSKRWSEKPPVGSTINWGNPLARGLIGAWILNEGSGFSIHDLTGVTPKSSNTFSSTLSWVKGVKGIALRNTNSGSGDSALVNNNPAWNTPNVTALSYVSLSTETGNTNRVFSLDAGSGNRRWALMHANVSNKFWFTTWTGVDAETNVADGTGFAVGVPKVLVGTYSPSIGIQALYVDGIFRNSASLTASLQSTTAKLAFTSSNNAGNPEWPGDMYAGYIWNRVLTSSEILSVSTNPYDFISPPAPRIRYFNVSGLAAAAGYGNTQLGIRSSTKVSVLANTKVTLVQAL